MPESKPEILKIYSYLVTHGKGDSSPVAIAGTDIPLHGPMFLMLNGIFDGNGRDTKIPICFKMSEEGEQNNPVRDDLIAFLKKPSIEAGTVLAKKLQDVTTARSGLGLLFLTVGKNERGEQRVLLSRFPADQGIIAETTDGKLEVSFVEKVFMKNAHAYKSVCYEGPSHDHDFWDGAAVDRQINTGTLADYWIREFLQSEFKITAKEGTRQLAVALKETAKKATDEKIKTEVIAATQLAKNLGGQSVSVNSFTEKFSLSKAAQEAVVKNLPHPDLATTTFTFDKEEFTKHASFISTELDSGVVLIAPSETFKDVIKQRKVENGDGKYEFSTVGKVVQQRIRNKK